MEKIVNFIMPKKCYFCGKISDGADICPDCMSSLPWRERTNVDIEYADGCFAPLSYNGKVVDAMHRFKFKGVQQMDVCLGKLVSDCVTESYKGEFDVVTWIPVNFMRRQKRRYDQAYLIAAQVAKNMSLPCKRFLVKKKNILPQFKMEGSAQRRANVSGAYAVTNETEIIKKRVLLIDDIVTSGSTLNECSRLLLMAGAESVTCACVAKAGK